MELQEEGEDQIAKLKELRDQYSRMGRCREACLKKLQ